MKLFVFLTSAGRVIQASISIGTAIVPIPALFIYFLNGYIFAPGLAKYIHLSINFMFDVWPNEDPKIFLYDKSLFVSTKLPDCVKC